MLPPGTTDRRRLAGAILMTGLIVQGVSLGWTNPIAFLAFLGPGCGLVGLGVLLFLLSPEE